MNTIRFGAYLKNLRMSHGLTQDDLAIALVVSQGYWTKLENGRQEPSLAMLLKIAEFFEVESSELIKYLDDRVLNQGDVGTYLYLPKVLTVEDVRQVRRSIELLEIDHKLKAMDKNKREQLEQALESSKQRQLAELAELERQDRENEKNDDSDNSKNGKADKPDKVNTR